MTKKKLLEYIKDECRENGVRFKSGRGKSVFSDGVYTTGYFDEDGPTLVVALGHPHWDRLLIHESCHMEQWVDGSFKKWSKHYEIFNDFLDGDANLSDKRLQQVVMTAMDCELDCEKRTVAKMKRLGYPVSKDYIQKANAYIYFYHTIPVTRRWYKMNNKPYDNRVIVSAAPNHFRGDYTRIPKTLEKAFEKEGFLG